MTQQVIHTLMGLTIYVGVQMQQVVLLHLTIKGHVYIVDDPIEAYTADGPTGDTIVLLFNGSGVDTRDTSAFSNNL